MSDERLEMTKQEMLSFLVELKRLFETEGIGGDPEQSERLYNATKRAIKHLTSEAAGMTVAVQSVQ